MRSLVKPGLFWVARIALVLSVVAWAFGQWFDIAASAYSPAGILASRVSNDGLEVYFDPRGAFYDASFSIRLPDSTLIESRDGARIRFGVPVFTAIRSNQYIVVPHYLIFTIFVLFYGVLKLVYRKREVAGE